MKYQTLLKQMTGLMLITLILVGCGGVVAESVAISTPVLLPATTASILPTNTPTPIPPTATPTPIPPTNTPTPIPTPPPTATTPPSPTPSTGRLEGKLIETELSSKKDAVRPSLAGALITLCLNTSEHECMVDMELSTQSDDQQAFVFNALPPGEYIVLYNPFVVADDVAYWEFWDGRKLDLTDAQTLINSFVPAETVYVSAGPGGGVGIDFTSGTFKSANENTAIWAEPNPLIVEFVAEQSPLTTEITAGQTSEITIQSHAKIFE